jgi:hypothetical protein
MLLHVAHATSTAFLGAAAATTDVSHPHATVARQTGHMIAAVLVLRSGGGAERVLGVSMQ